jgi:hypothetical protein
MTNEHNALMRYGLVVKDAAIAPHAVTLRTLTRKYGVSDSVSPASKRLGWYEQKRGEVGRWTGPRPQTPKDVEAVAKRLMQAVREYQSNAKAMRERPLVTSPTVDLFAVTKGESPAMQCVRALLDKGNVTEENLYKVIKILA